MTHPTTNSPPLIPSILSFPPLSQNSSDFSSQKPNFILLKLRNKMKNDFEEDDYSLTLNLGFPSTTTTPTPKPQQQQNQYILSNKNKDEPSLTLLTLSGEAGTTEPPCMSATGTVSSSFKREHETGSCVDVAVDVERGGGGSDEDDGGFGVMNTRKKLRLTKPQSALLEHSFKLQTTLNPKQKQALADRLNLRPRQVEVWFQNRRARTKLKQTEVDREYLKKYCETLTDENRRLEKEVRELKAMKVGPPVYMHLPAATLTICPSCERIGGKGAVVPSIVGTTNSAKSSFSLGPKTHRFIAASPNRPLLVDN